jgi:hypothetical protein
MNADDFFAEREIGTAERVDAFRAGFVKHLQGDGARMLGNDGCVYVVGSAGRGEMTTASDLDLFLVTHASYKRVHEILAQAAVLRMMAEHGLPEASNDAGFLKLHTAESLAQRLGDVQDDFSNTFTVRMLLLLESRFLYGEDSYVRLLHRVVDAYWRNEAGHATDYLPLVLVNDIVRYWRVIILNYEARFGRKLNELPEDKKDDPEAIAKVKNEKRFASYKLRFSRCMTCYSMIAHLLAEATDVESKTPHVSREAFLDMVRSTPVQRLQQVRGMVMARGDQHAAGLINDLLDLYRGYLELREELGETAVAVLASEDGKGHFERAENFGEKMFELIQRLGSDSPLYRYVVT